MLRRARLGLAGVVMLLIVATAAILAPIIAPHDPNDQDLRARLTCPIGASCQRYGSTPPQTITGSSNHLLGTDNLGRDIYSRILYGAKISLIVGITAVALGGGIGTVLGLVSGYSGGVIDAIIGRIADVQLAFPFLLLAILISIVSGPGLKNVIIILSIGAWVPFARVVRGSTLAAKEYEYVVAARTIGARAPTILFRHILPNVVTPVIVIATFAVAGTIIAEAGLSFLGLGVGTSVPTWGNMLADGRAYISTAWWLATFPGVAIMLTVLSINLIGDWLRDILDPRLRNMG
ncbi:MAG: ABC transporter permease [Chloroflexota bacterium]|nr:ABC transporter permease [Chloroflexota bacterium]